MATADLARGLRSLNEEAVTLAADLRRLARAATAVSLLTSPALALYLIHQRHWPWWGGLLGALAGVIMFRGFVDVVVRRLIPLPSLFAVEDQHSKVEDVVNRRRAWWWRKFYGRTLFFFAPVAIGLWAVVHYFGASTLLQMLVYVVMLPFFLLFNFVILFGPLMLVGMTQMRGFEPGDADWGVRLEDVRGQAEAKEEVRKIVTLWQSGELFEKAGGKRERGLLFHGPPGTGKTMLAKAIATSFNAPFISMPGSGFAQTFIGMDAVIVRWLSRKAKRLARKWGGQCIVFIDEIDAVGMRRASLQGEHMTTLQQIDAAREFYGPFGAVNAGGDLIVESEAWRDHLFVQRAPERRSPYPRWLHRLDQAVPGGMMGMGGQLALNQLLVVMDGMDNPPYLRRVLTNLVNNTLDASYLVPRRIGRVSLRIRPPRPRKEQIYFVGATNVPVQNLDPALTRPGRMGRHVWFRTPTKNDRKDIFDLYLGKVAHDEDLDGERRRDEIARITNGYAQPLDARLLTPTGWTRMGAVAVGDELVGADGAGTRVVAVHPRGTMDVYRVAFNDGTSTECTADHLWTVEAADPRMLPRTFTLQELLDRGLHWSESGSRCYLPRLAPVQLSGETELPLDPYLLGLLLGDGGFTSTTPDFCTADPESLASVEALLPARMTATRHGPMNWWLSGGRRGGVQRGRTNPLTETFRRLDLWGVRGHDKFVPEQYKWASVQDRLALLQGLMDADGNRDYRRGTGPTFYSHSARLADDVAFLARSLGGTARVAAKRGGWRISVDLPDGLVPFRLRRKADAYRSSRRPFRKRILAVERVGQKPVQCVTVAAPDGLYVTDGFTLTHNSPAMIDQVCSVALTYAHHDGRAAFSWGDLLEAMSVTESGAAINVKYVEHETRAVAIHEAGHAAAAHVYRPEVESSRLSIRMRPGSLGHHQSFEREERFTKWHREYFGDLVHGLAAMAAEHVFYGENASGVSGDLDYATQTAASMAGISGMGPMPIDAGTFADESPEQTRERVLKRFEDIGAQLMNRTRGSADAHADPIASIMRDPYKNRRVAQILGQAYVTAYNFVAENRDKVEQLANALVEKRELYGDELVGLLNEKGFTKPEIDWTRDATWPRM
jgi:ATP-dependent Zn protease